MKLHKKHELRYYCLKLIENEPFALSRYGDGEWKAILIGMTGGELHGQNADYCTYSHIVCKELRRALRYQFKLPFEYNLLNVGRRMKKDIIPFMRKTNLDITWIKGDIMLNDNLAGKFYPFVYQMRKKNVLYVGPQHCKQLGRFFDLKAFVNIPAINATMDKKRIINEILRKIKKHKIDVVGFSAGFAANVFIADLWHLTKKRVTLIDFGSLWDGYFGVQSRSYIHKVDWEALVEVNTGKRIAKPGEKFRLKLEEVTNVW